MIYKPQRLLGEALEFSCKKYPHKSAVIFGGMEYSYTDLYKAAENLAFYLCMKGIKKGDRISVFMNNSWECAVAIYGITLAGGVFLVVNPQTKANKLQYILEDCGAKIFIAEAILHNEFRQILEDSNEIIDVILSGRKDNAKYSFNFSDFETVTNVKHGNIQLPYIIPNDLAALIYTSGSTGFPKGVMMTHQAMVFTSWSLIEYLRLTEDERIMLVLPLAFDYGLYQLIMSVTIGGTLIIEQSFNFPPSIFRKMDEFRPTVFPGVPSMYAIMIATHQKTGITFDSVRKITNTAANLPNEFVNDLKHIFPNALIFKMYGLTECKRVSYLEPELIDQKPNSVGKPIPGTDVFILDINGNPVKPGETGTLYVRGPHVMAGYWNKDELTNEMLKPGLVPGERILCAHDQFKVDEDGFLYFQGRNDDIIKTRGEKVSPTEVENAIHEIKGIREAAVIGIPDVMLGESIIAFVTTHEKAVLHEKDIQFECRARLESFMIPQKIIFVEEMPKSSNGKIDKSELKKNYL